MGPEQLTIEQEALRSDFDRQLVELRLAHLEQLITKVPEERRRQIAEIVYYVIADRCSDSYFAGYCIEEGMRELLKKQVPGYPSPYQEKLNQWRSSFWEKIRPQWEEAGRTGNYR